MISRSFFVGSLLSMAALALGGCSASSAPGDPDEDLAQGEDNLSAAASPFVGSYSTGSPAAGGFASLELDKSGTYSAQLDGAGKIVCVKAPCLLPEDGKWTASKRADGSFRLRIRPSSGAGRVYEAARAGSTLTLTRSGAVETLTAAGATPGKVCGGIARIQCSSTEDCVDDPTDSCDPKAGGRDCSGTCQAKSKPGKLCGGIARILCAGSDECVDDPSDSCDPKAGGRDCSGTCQPKTR